MTESKQRTPDSLERKSAACGLVENTDIRYLNSILQTLYATPEFKSAIVRYSIMCAEDLNLLPVKLQKLFLELQCATAACDTSAVTSCLGPPAKRKMEMDEFWHMLLGMLKRDLETSPLANLIRELFTGELENYTACDKCGQQEVRKMPYISIPLRISESVELSIRDQMKPQKMKGTMACSGCGCICDYFMGDRYTHFPLMLVLQLIKAEEKVSDDTVKPNHRMKFFEDMDLEPFHYTHTDGNDRRSKAPELQQPGGASGDENKNLYELCAVFMHSEEDPCGHYFVYIKDLSNGLWSCCDDSEVALMSNGFLADMFDGNARSANAYMLMYHRIDKRKDKEATLVNIAESEHLPLRIGENAQPLRATQESQESPVSQMNRNEEKAQAARKYIENRMKQLPSEHDRRYREQRQNELEKMHQNELQSLGNSEGKGFEESSHNLCFKNRQQAAHTEFSHSTQGIEKIEVKTCFDGISALSRESAMFDQSEDPKQRNKEPVGSMLREIEKQTEEMDLQLEERMPHDLDHVIKPKTTPHFHVIHKNDGVVHDPVDMDPVRNSHGHGEISMLQNDKGITEALARTVNELHSESQTNITATSHAKDSPNQEPTLIGFGQQKHTEQHQREFTLQRNRELAETVTGFDALQEPRNTQRKPRQIGDEDRRKFEKETANHQHGKDTPELGTVLKDNWLMVTLPRQQQHLYESDNDMAKRLQKEEMIQRALLHGKHNIPNIAPKNEQHQKVNIDSQLAKQIQDDIWQTDLELDRMGEITSLPQGQNGLKRETVVNSTHSHTVEVQRQQELIDKLEKERASLLTMHMQEEAMLKDNLEDWETIQMSDRHTRNDSVNMGTNKDLRLISECKEKQRQKKSSYEIDQEMANKLQDEEMKRVTTAGGGAGGGQRSRELHMWLDMDKNDRLSRESDPQRKALRNRSVDGDVMMKSLMRQRNTFQFWPVDEVWQRRVCGELGLAMILSKPYCSSTCYPRPIGKPRDFVKVRGDGNCLFRSLSTVITGDEENHEQIRIMVVSRMEVIGDLLRPHLPPDVSSVQEYIKQSHMGQSGSWGTNIELYAAANLLQTDIFLYGISGKVFAWSRYSPSELEFTADVSEKAIYIQHTYGDHFDIVSGVSQLD